MAATSLGSPWPSKIDKGSISLSLASKPLKPQSVALIGATGQEVK